MSPGIHSVSGTTTKCYLLEIILSLLQYPKMNKESSTNLRLILDNISKNLHSLTALGLYIANWDPLIILKVSEGLDYTTAREWEEVKVSGELPTLGEFT